MAEEEEEESDEEMGFGLFDDDAGPSIVHRKVFGAPAKKKSIKHEAG